MSLRTHVLLAALALAPLLPGAAVAADGIIRLRSGEQQVMQRDGAIDRVAVGDPAVADVRVVSPRELLVQGKDAGSTTLILWSGGDGSPETLHVLVDGGSRLVDEALRQHGGAGLRVQDMGPVRRLDGTADSLEQYGDARVLAGADAGEPLVDDARLSFGLQVQIDLKIVELSRSVLHGVGINLMNNTLHRANALSPPGAVSSIEGEGAGSRGDFPGFIFGGSFLPIGDAFNLVTANSTSGFVGALSILEANGYAHTLAEPSLTVMSSQSASFLAGGEFPIPVAQGQDGAISVEYREFGVRVTLRPLVISPDRISLKIAPEVSELDFSAGISAGGVAVPALRTRRSDTTVELGDGESFIISGLINRTTAGSIDRVPWLGQVPILGAFFRSMRFASDERELLMIVSPRLVRPIRSDAEMPGLPGADLPAYDPSFSDMLLRGRVAPAGSEYTR